MKSQLHPGVKWAWRISGWMVSGILLVILFGIVFVPAALALSENFQMGFATSIGFFFLVFLVLAGILLGINEVIVQMAYNRWFYEFSDSGLKLERGIIWKRYSNVPYERIQNVDIHRGLLARMLGFSALMIQTAGYSANPYAEGYIPGIGVEEAEQIREHLMKRISKKSQRGM